MIKRDDERKETKGDMGASMARTPEAARRDEAPHVTEHVSKEHDDPIGDETSGEGSGMARSAGKAKSSQERVQREERSDGEGEHEVKSGRGIKHVTVEADHVIGDGGDIGTASAEGESDMASGKANRKEAMEPEREENEKAAIGRERTVPTKNTMGHGERETIARHTI
jgi:hypothetical protein